MEKAMKSHMGYLYFAIVVGAITLLLLGAGCSRNSYSADSNSAVEVEEENKMMDASAMMEKEQTRGDMEMKAMMDKMEVSDDKMMLKMEGPEKGVMMAKTDYMYEGPLKDVSESGASGLARAGFDNGTYKLLASFSGLPEPSGTDFYEGWIVRKDPFHFISTGRVEKIGGIYTNVYQSKDNLTDHNFYVLTIEPDDNDPAPAAHVVEGTMLKK